MTAEKTDLTKTDAQSEKAQDLKSFSDTLLEDIAAEALPAMIQAHQLTRRKRADLLVQVQALTPRVQMLQHVLDTGNTEGVNGAEVAAFMADIEDVLATVSMDEMQFKAWAVGADDAQLLGLFARFVSQMTGEASRSSS